MFSPVFFLEVWQPASRGFNSMTFERYQKLSNTRHRSRIENQNMKRFCETQPTRCPKCGCQVFDPFGIGLVIHDIVLCLQADLKGEK